MSSPWVAWPTGTDVPGLASMLRQAHDDFLATGQPSASVRAVVLESWRRCVDRGIRPEGSLPPVDLTDADLRGYRDDHPLARVMPVIRRLLLDEAVDSHLVAVSDAGGRLLWVEGDSSLVRRAEQMNFVEGAQWSEEYAGTNAPGTALAVDHAVQIFTGEHFSRTVHPWSCSAAPVHDPQTGGILGVLDLTGGDDVAAPQSLVVVRAAVAAIEAELRLQLLARPRGRGPRPQMTELARLAVLGRSDAELRWGDRVVTLSLRHAELLLLLALHPEGRSAEQLAVDLHHSDPPLVTIRAEMSRLRRLLGEQAMTSRPYRLTRPLRTDVEELRTLLVRGAHRKALEHYRGPVLPRSCAPAIEELRAEVAAEVREAILRHGAPEVLASYAESPSGTDDVRALRAAVAALSPGSPRRTMLRARLTLLERAVGPAATSLATRLQPSRS